MGQPINPDAKNLEDAFFARQDAELLEKLRQQARLKERRDALREVAPRADDALIDRMMELGIGPEVVLALTLVPLTLVAWADGAIDAKERAVLLRAAEERGITPGSPAREMFERWLDRKPGPQLVETWKRYIRAIWADFDESEHLKMRTALIGMARDVAEAAGGFLGLGSKVSPAERAVLKDLEATLQ